MRFEAPTLGLRVCRSNLASFTDPTFVWPEHGQVSAQFMCWCDTSIGGYGLYAHPASSPVNRASVGIRDCDGPGRWMVVRADEGIIESRAMKFPTAFVLHVGRGVDQESLADCKEWVARFGAGALASQAYAPPSAADVERCLCECSMPVHHPITNQDGHVIGVHFWWRAYPPGERLWCRTTDGAVIEGVATVNTVRFVAPVIGDVRVCETSRDRDAMMARAARGPS